VGRQFSGILNRELAGGIDPPVSEARKLLSTHALYADEADALVGLVTVATVLVVGATSLGVEVSRFVG